MSARPRHDDRRKVLVPSPPRIALVTRIKDDMIHNLNTTMTHLTAAEQQAWLQVYRKSTDRPVAVQVSS